MCDVSTWSLEKHQRRNSKKSGTRRELVVIEHMAIGQIGHAVEPDRDEVQELDDSQLYGLARVGPAG